MTRDVAPWLNRFYLTATYQTEEKHITRGDWWGGRGAHAHMSMCVFTAMGLWSCCLKCLIFT